MFITDQHRQQIREYFKGMNLYIKNLETVKDTRLDEFLNNEILQAAAERSLHIALECATDAGNLIIDALIMRDPSSYEDIIQTLAEENVFPADFSVSFQDAVRYRRVLAHDYLERNPQRLYEVIQAHLHEFAAFEAYISAYVMLGTGV